MRYVIGIASFIVLASILPRHLSVITIGAFAALLYYLHQLKSQLRDAQDKLDENQAELFRRIASLERKLHGLSETDSSQSPPKYTFEAAPQNIAPRPPAPNDLDSDPSPDAKVTTPTAEKPSDVQWESAYEQKRASREAESDMPPFESKLSAFLKSAATIPRIGALLLLMGVGFLVKYVSELGLFPIEFRLALTALGGMILTGVGWKLRSNKTNLGLILIGTGIGVFYLTTFGAYRLYSLIPAELTFALLVLSVLAMGFFAAAFNSQNLANIAVISGFSAPILASSGSGNYVFLFSYYGVLNAGILYLSWKKSWRMTNVIGFVFTYGIGAVWGQKYYIPENLWSVEPFVIYHFLLYLVVGLLYSRTRPSPEASPLSAVDGSIVFGTPVATFAIQSALFSHFRYGIAISAIILSFVYLGLGFQLLRKWGDSARLLLESFLAIGIIFATLAVPFALSAQWTSAVWALEATGILWLGIRQRRPLARAFALLVQIGSAGLFFLNGASTGTLPFFNPLFLGHFILAVSFYASGVLIYRSKDELLDSEHLLENLYGASSVFALMTGLNGQTAGLEGGLNSFLTEAGNAFPSYWRTRPNPLRFWFLFPMGCLGLYMISTRLAWPLVRWARLLLYPSIATGILVGLWQNELPFAGTALIWILSTLGLNTFLLRKEAPAPLSRSTTKRDHAFSFWIVALLTTWQLHGYAERSLALNHDWSWVLPAMLALTMIAAVCLTSEKTIWPFGPNQRAYIGLGCTPVLFISILIVAFYIQKSPGLEFPVPYIPVLNPLELTGVFMLLVASLWFLRARALEVRIVDQPMPYYVGLGVLAFAMVTMILIRGLHHYADTPWQFPDTMHSRKVQMGLSLYWTSLSMFLMVYGHRKILRLPWQLGGTLLAVVVIKLFLMDLSGSNTLERIISFLGTGVLLLVIGYCAPLPPKKGQS